ncbi:MAG: hypothetical protein E7319_10400 [Clostridiales bacterium]|nr:hypothetical protein [Clostridiales bacterium]
MANDSPLPWAKGFRQSKYEQTINSVSSFDEKNEETKHAGKNPPIMACFFFLAKAANARIIEMLDKMKHSKNARQSRAGKEDTNAETIGKMCA